jgi:hypothetical protein
MYAIAKDQFRRHDFILPCHVKQSRDIFWRHAKLQAVDDPENLSRN